VLRCLRAAVRTKQFIRPKRAQTCASWMTVTTVAGGSVSGIGIPFGHGAWALCVVRGSTHVPKNPIVVRKGSYAENKK